MLQNLGVGTSYGMGRCSVLYGMYFFKVALYCLILFRLLLLF